MPDRPRATTTAHPAPGADDSPAAAAPDADDSPGAAEASADRAWWVYLVRCADGSLYAGIARNCQERLAEHNAGRGAKYTRSRLPVELVYAEPAADRSSAQQREYEIKRLPRERKIELIGT